MRFFPIKKTKQMADVQKQKSTESLRKLATDLFSRAVAAADPALAVRRTLAVAPLPRPRDGGRTILVAIGKAAPAMLREAIKHVSGPYQALAVTQYENQETVMGAQVMQSGHPVPDEAGQKAGQEILKRLAGANQTDQVIALISGGGSALVPTPTQGITLADKAKVNRQLLASGLDIGRMNLVRQQLSDLKGGGFLRHAAPAPVSAYILSDVIGDDLRAIASGPTTGPTGDRVDARNMLKELGIYENLPVSVQAHLNLPDRPRTVIPAQNTLVGSNRQSLDAVRVACSGRIEARIVSDALVGDVAAATQTILKAVENAPPNRAVALLFGGETTVRLSGDGLGGRNQELALRVAVAIDEHDLARDWVFLSGGTDGRDGPTEAAGGIVDRGTITRLNDLAIDPINLLANNDSYHALKASGDLLVTGATGTNVADIQIFLLAPGDKAADASNQ